LLPTIDDLSEDRALELIFSFTKASPTPEMTDELVLDFVRRIRASNNRWLMDTSPHFLLLLDYLAPHTSATGLDALLSIVEMRPDSSLNDGSEIQYLIRGMAGRASVSLWRRVLGIASRIPNELYRKIILAKLVPLLPAEAVLQGFRVAQSIPYDYDRIDA